MTRRERTLKKAWRLEMKAIKATMRNYPPFSWRAHRAASRAAAYFAKARLLLSALRDREEAKAREKEKRKLPTEWWKRKR